MIDDAEFEKQVAIISDSLAKKKWVDGKWAVHKDGFKDGARWAKRYLKGRYGEKLRDALGHSNCYCDQCKKLSNEHWGPKSEGKDGEP